MYICAEEVLKSLYDYGNDVGNPSNENSAFDKYQDLKLSFTKAGFNTRKWVTNSHSLQRRRGKSEGLNAQNIAKQSVKLCLKTSLRNAKLRV